MSDFNKTGLEELSAGISSGKIKPSEIIDNCRKIIDKTESDLHALNRITLDRASAGIEELKFDPNKPYSGIPFVQKDNICTKGVETTCSSKILRGFVPPYSATADSRLQDAGFRIIGKANMDEFAMGSSTEFSATGPARNPYDLTRVPGGSSGGSAVAVAVGYAPFALGSDTGGSVRQPAAFCGLVGLRPTYGRVSRWGLVAFASSLDQIGPITLNVRDTAIVLSIIEGTDNYDSTLVDRPKENFLAEIENGIADLRIGVLDAGTAEWVDPRVKKNFEENVDWFGKHAKSVKEVSIKSFDLILAAYYIIAPSEASSNLARFDGIRFGPSVKLAPPDEYPDDGSALGLYDYYRKNRGRGFGDEVTRRILIGTFALSSGYYDAYYLRAQKVRTKVRDEFDQLRKEVDVIISPTAPTPPFKLGSRTDDPLAMYREDLFVLPQAMAGCPAISINGGWTDMDDDNVSELKNSGSKNFINKPADRLPIGLQITASPFAESILFRTARAFEKDHEG
ncbi:MAG: Asp-tRNA(Asn)/Glu-tRNA(Gln) amidotransferase subunit GatA [bacterium]